MKMLHVVTLVAVLTASSTLTVTAQNDTRVGIGIGLTGGEFGSSLLELATLAPVSIYVPVDFGSFRIEPEIGIFRASIESGDVEQTSTILQLGSGLFAQRGSGSTTLYYGGRVGITRQSSSVDTPAGDSDDSSTNFFIGPAVGAEYAFSSGFSLGGEAQLLYTSIGQEDDDDDTSISIIRTRPIFFVRWYFGN